MVIIIILQHILKYFMNFQFRNKTASLKSRPLTSSAPGFHGNLITSLVVRGCGSERSAVTASHQAGVLAQYSSSVNMLKAVILIGGPQKGENPYLCCLVST